MKILTLTLNPTFDIHCKGPKLLLGKENLFEITSKEAGGKGVNISRALHHYGKQSTALIVMGEENGDEYIEKIKEDIPSYTTISVPGRIRENVTIHPEEGQETRVIFKGFPVNDDVAGPVIHYIEDHCDDQTILTVTGSLPTGMNADMLKPTLKKLQKVGTKIVIDSKSFTLDDIKDVHPYLIKPNEEEISVYFNKDITDKNMALECADKLRDIADNVIVSMGGQGAVLACENGKFSVNAPDIKAISTIGAGDSMIAGFICKCDELSNLDCLKLGIAFGSAACLTEGTNPPNKEDIDRIINQL